MSTPEITKRRVEMSIPIDGGAGGPVHDFVRPDFLDAYVADAKMRWESVVVSDEPDAGPGGYHGETHIPAHLDHPLAGQTFAATTED